jgi:hypothetical protein
MSTTSDLSQITLVCPECGYDLRAIESGRCPECGLEIDRAAMSVSRLPWAHRRKIGPVRAYWRTNRLAIVRRRRLAEEINRPVSFSDARRFLLVTATLAWIPAAAWIVVGLFSDDGAGLKAGRGHGITMLLEPLAIAAIVLAPWLFFYMAGAVGSYFFHPKSMPVVRQNRAIALSYYACAPLAWLWLPAAVMGGVYFILSQPWGRSIPDGWMITASIAGVCLILAILLVWWLDTIALLRRTTHCGGGRAAALTCVLPSAWLICFVIAGVVPAAIIYISLVVLSVR